MWGSDEVDIEHLISLVEERPVLGDKDKSLDEYKSDREKKRERERERERGLSKFQTLPAIHIRSLAETNW